MRVVVRKSFPGLTWRVHFKTKCRGRQAAALVTRRTYTLGVINHPSVIDFWLRAGVTLSASKTESVSGEALFVCAWVRARACQWAEG